ncbi:MAG: hypothetical protein ACFE8U_08580 [Candidatus Hermodarchaeota archaeon]
MQQFLGDNNILIKNEGETDVSIKVREILLLNKKSGLPILSRVYGEASGKDPVLVAGLLAAIIQFAETMGSNLELNDIGIGGESRIFIRTQSQLVCLLIIDNFNVSFISGSNFLLIINEIASRVFDVIRMMFSVPNAESFENLGDSDGDIDNLLLRASSDVALNNLDESAIAAYPEIGYIIDNIVFETTMMFSIDDKQVEEKIEDALTTLEETDSTYLGSNYSGTSKEITKDKQEKYKDVFARLNKFWEDSEVGE